MNNNDKKNHKKTGVSYVKVSFDDEGQRIDNFLVTHLKSVPKSRIYRMLRKGEVRVNMKRISPFYRLAVDDSIRLPPVSLEEKASPSPPSQQTAAKLTDRILYEDDNLLILNKPSGMSVHAGSTVRVGVIEALRHIYPKLPNLELAHRLDSDTSGCLILAKKKRILREIHGLLREGKVTKIYWTLTQGRWKKAERLVDLPLHKTYGETGKHRVEVHHDGKSSLTEFRPIKEFAQASLVGVRLYTGRTHQIRVHAMHQGHPIAGDDRYGDKEFNKWAHQLGLRRLFLHASSIEFTLASLAQKITVTAPLDSDLETFLASLQAQSIE